MTVLEPKNQNKEKLFQYFEKHIGYKEAEN